MIGILIVYIKHNSIQCFFIYTDGTGLENVFRKLKNYIKCKHKCNENENNSISVKL